MQLALELTLGALGIGVGIAVNWLIWFRLLPAIYRNMRQAWKRPG